MSSRIATVLVLALVIPACGGDDGDLAPGAVTDLPPGNGTGTAASGDYTMESITTRCSGECTTNIEGFTYSACDIGTRLDSSASVLQADGSLTIDIDSDYVSRLEGGIDADGTYEVGGLRPQNGGEIIITARAIGVLDGNTMIGSASLLVKGMGLDCRIEVDIDGARD